MPNMKELIAHLEDNLESLKYCITEHEVQANTTACLALIENTCEMIRRRLQ